VVVVFRARTCCADFSGAGPISNDSTKWSPMRAPA